MKITSISSFFGPSPGQPFGFLRKSMLSGLFCLAFLFAALPTVMASHYRGGNMSWTQVSGNTVSIKIQQAWRWSAFSNPAIGTSVTIGTLDFGDGSSATYNLTVTSTSASEDWFFGETTVTHAYATTGNKTLFWSSCCRLSTQQNNTDGSMSMISTVNVGSTNNSPQVLNPVLLSMPIGQAAATYQLPGIDADGNTLQYRFATAAEAAAGSSFTQPAGLSVSSTGLVTFNTTGKTLGHLWNTAIVVEDLDANGNIQSKVMTDFLIKIVGNSPPPTFGGNTPANGSTLTGTCGVPFSFTASCSGEGGVAIQAVGVPNGGVFTPALPTASTTFNWANPAVGDYLIVLIAQNPDGSQTSISFTIHINNVADGDGDGYTTCTGDCDDNDININPGETEIPNNGIDENCDGLDLLPYCTPVISNACGYMWLTNVTIGSINNNSGCSSGGYGNYAATLSTTVVPGNTYTISITGGGSYNQNSRVFVDWNSDGDFTDAGETVVNSLFTYYYQANSTTFTVPANASSGGHLMRVISAYEGSPLPTPCAAEYGEAEDYVLMIAPSCSPTLFTVGGGGYSCDEADVDVTLSGSQTGYTYQLKKDGVSTGPPVSGTGNPIVMHGHHGGVYTVVASTNAGSCTALMTGSVNIVETTPAVYSVSGGGVFCFSPGGSVSLSDSDTGFDYQLHKDGSPVGSPLAGTGLALSFENLTTAGSYTIEAINQADMCEAVMTGSVSITIDPVSVGGTAGANQTICTGSVPATLNLSGHTGLVEKWQSSPDGSTWSDIANTTTSHSPSALTSTTHYRAVVQSGVCPEENATAAIITVDENTVAGSVGASQTICSGSVPATLNVTGHLGSVVKWQSSPNNTAWTDIANTTTSHSPGALSSIFFYRSVVKNGVCPEANSAAATIDVTNQSAVGGTVTPSQTICSGTAPYTLFLQNQAGDVEKWQSSPDGSAWSDIANTTTSLSPGTLTATTHFRAVVLAGVCPLGGNSTVAIITVNPQPAPVATPVGPLCVNGAAASLSATPTGGTFSGAGVSGSSFNPATAGIGSHVISYSVTVSGCTGSTNQTIVVNGLPSVSLSNFSAVCVSAAAFPLSGGSPSGGTYSGPGVSGGNFDPATAGTGTHTITYSVTTSGCTASTSKTIVVNALPSTPTLANQPTVCTTAPAFALTGGLPSGGTYSGTGVSGGNFSAVAAGSGTHIITYTVTNSNGCAATTTKNLTVSGSCSTSCTIMTCPPARDVNMTAACKISIPNLVSEVVLNGDCASPAVITQSPAAGTLPTATHNVVQNVTINVVDAAGNTATCTVALTPKDVSAPTITNCSASATNTVMTSACKISIPNFASMTTVTDCGTGTITKTQVPAANTLITAVHNQTFSVVVTVTDAQGNSATCTRTAIAKDQAKPTISTCAPAETVPLAVGCVLTFPDKTGQLVATDACSNPLVKTQSPAANSTVVTTPGATHTMTFTVTDAAGNTKTCTTTITAGASCPTMLLGQDENETEAVKAPVFVEKTAGLTEKPLDLQTMPNPFSDELTIAFDLVEAAQTKLVLLDLTGQFQLFEKENWLGKGRQKVVWNTEDLPGGAYFVGLKTENSGWVWRKVMLVR